MYMLTVLLLLLILPLTSLAAEHMMHPDAALMALVGKWFVFWAAGGRLFLAGLRQMDQPRFTAATIFGLTGEEALPIVRELGVANTATGIGGLVSLALPDFTRPVALVAAVFYGLAGLRHLAHGGRNRMRTTAMISDLMVSAVFAAYVAWTLTVAG